MQHLITPGLSPSRTTVCPPTTSPPLVVRPVALLLAAVLAITVLPARAEEVNESTADWGFLEEIAAGRGFFSFPEGGPPPSGLGAAIFEVDGTGRMILGTDRYNGTRLDDLTLLEYSTYRLRPVDGVLALSLQINVDYDLTDGDESWQGRLVFEPYLDGSSVDSLVWQTWDAAAGLWWASGSPGNGTCPQGAPCTWAQVLTAFPDAGVHATLGGVLLKAGGPWLDGFVGAADLLRVGVSGVTTDFDFETGSFVFADGLESGNTDGWSSVVP
ncbi:MAG: hypothetical protein MI919_41600 [Holophagales bacterium]|nr:hypothetical protein [Holophagales bacterium]